MEKIKMKLQPNFNGKIDPTKLKYTVDDAESERIDPLFPETRNKGWHGVKQNRIRLVDKSEIPSRLPTNDLMPYPIDEDDFIGEYESKKNIYLTFAHAFNKLMEEVENLRKELELLKSSKK